MAELRGEDIDQIFGDYAVNNELLPNNGHFNVSDDIDFALDNQQRHPVSPQHFQQELSPDVIPEMVDEMDVLLQQREEVRLRNEARGILDACASTKSIADLQNFNRDYPPCIAQTANACYKKVRTKNSCRKQKMGSLNYWQRYNDHEGMPDLQMKIIHSTRGST